MKLPRLAAVVALATGLAVVVPAVNPAGAAPLDKVRHALDLVRAGYGSDQALSVKDVVTDADGTTHVRVTRTYKGLPVLGGDFVVHESGAGALKSVSATAARTLTLDTRAAVSSTRAESAVRGKLAGPAALLVDATSGTPRLVYDVTTGGYQADGTPSELHTYVDATSGKVLRTEQRIETADGDGQSLYSGTVALRTTASGGSYQLKDPTRGNTYTGDAQNKTDVCILIICIVRAPATLFTDADNHWGNGTTTDRATAAVDAQYGTDTTWDFYLNTFGRQGIGADGKGSYNRVHYGSNYVNAFWDDNCFCMTYGDGDGVQAGPLTSLDVTGHEMSHGVTSRTAGLTYSGESGGLNEATSDIMGTMVEFSAANANDPGDYLIGEKAFKDRPALRYMDKPSKDGASADCWSSSVKNLDVHYSSGVANHFFYLASEGSGAKTINGVAYDSPACDGSTVTGIGRDKAAKIWYRALTVYMTSSTNYAGARTATLSAATDLYGAASPEYASVAAAWSAVNVH
ncbi:M4 family metallopeptidase [Labedaea rhizosphaerae]|uniref:Neutral metalloproteinase n=1 Tax=Labedaea rhizosphaerae TaxID=598644 RepID=A0A4V3CYR6_LABRH|nr:M4 family metallopeptidase [Labedaea rhizosphaerae]TDP95148.1 griselysin [Labedaea rhizosphaerae]